MTIDPAAQPISSLSAWMQAHPHLRLIRIDSDAMEPTIARGDVIIFDATETTVEEDAIYLLDYAELPVLRRLQRRPGRVAVMCDNPHYQEQEVSTAKIDALNVLGRAIAHLRQI